MLRDMSEQQFERIGIERMGQRIRIVRAAAELTEEDLNNEDENTPIVPNAEIQTPAIEAEGEAEEEINNEENEVTRTHYTRTYGGW